MSAERREALERLSAELADAFAADPNHPDAHTFEQGSKQRIRDMLETYVQAFPYFEAMQGAAYHLASQL